MLQRIVLAPLLAVTLSNCAGPRAIIGLDQQQIHIGNSATIPFLVATTRAPSGTLDPLYSNDRTLNASFSQIDVSVPASHKAGMVETTSNSPDPDRHFVATNYSQIADAGSFENVINARLAKRPLAQRRVFIFVHGFNNNFAEGLFRNAQIVLKDAVQKVAAKTTPNQYADAIKNAIFTAPANWPAETAKKLDAIIGKYKG